MPSDALPSTPAAALSRGYAICLVGTVLWSTTAIFIRYLTETFHLPSLVLAFWRDVFFVITLLAGLLIFNRSRLRDGWGHKRFLLLYGLVLAVFNATWTVSVSLNGAAVATVLAYSSPAFTAILGWRLFHERMTPFKIFVISLSMAGCLLISGAHRASAWSLNPLGILTGLVSGMMFAAYSLMGTYTVRRSLNSWAALLYAFTFAAGFLLLFNVLFDAAQSATPLSSLFWLKSSAVGWLVLFALAAGPTLGGYGLYTLSLTYLPATVANLIATLEPAFTAVLAYLLLAERFTPDQIWGSGLILLSVILLRLRPSLN